MWHYNKEKLNEYELKFSISSEHKKLSFEEVFLLWAHSEPFRLFYNALLSEQPFRAFFWEHPPLNYENKDDAYEFVLVDSAALVDAQPDTAAFDAYFEDNEWVVSFENLGKDAELVVPCPVSESNAYTHLANFVRMATTEQGSAFWQKLGNISREKIGANLFWLSTAGLGVYWLHVRLDSRPKYYKHINYKK